MPSIPNASAVDVAAWTAGETVRPASSGAAGSIRDLQNRFNAQAAKASKAKDVGQQFEAMYLRQMLDEFMPKDSDTLFGKGTAGTMWRSMLVDGLATQLSKSGSIGLARMVIKPQPTLVEGKK